MLKRSLILLILVLTHRGWGYEYIKRWVVARPCIPLPAIGDLADGAGTRRDYAEEKSGN